MLLAHLCNLGGREGEREREGREGGEGERERGEKGGREVAIVSYSFFFTAPPFYSRLITFRMGSVFGFVKEVICFSCFCQSLRKVAGLV